ncbi:MAG: ScpA family protein [Patescibacteria group bacterium]
MMLNELKLEKFQGPLSLLLQLIEQEKLDITEVALSKVTEQYFYYLDKLEESRPEELADFLVIAARLIYLKSKNLLPHLYPEEDDSGSDLADQLKIYKKYLEASVIINRMWEEGKTAYGRVEPPPKTFGQFVAPLNARSEELREAMTALLRRIKPVDPLPKIKIDMTLTVKRKLETLYSLLKQKNRFDFNEMLSDAKNKTEIIVSFLAVLELAKSGKIIIKQTNIFTEMTVEKV